MCLSTAYLNHKDDDKVAARYVSSVRVEGSKVILTDIMGIETEIEGTLTYIDLTGGTVIVATGDAA